MRNSLATLFAVTVLLAWPAAAAVNPPVVEASLEPGESLHLEKFVDVPQVPPSVDICLLEDETGSFADDIEHLQTGTTATDIFDGITAIAPDAEFAVAGFRDYPVAPYGNAGDWVYRLLSPMSPDLTDWLNGIAALTAGGGNDGPEAQYDAIVAATGPGVFNDPTVGEQDPCGWRDNPDGEITRVLLVTTDASFHLPGTGKPHVNTQASTVAALLAEGIVVVGLKAPGSGGELDALAAATGGTTQPLSSDGSDIAAAILAALQELIFEITGEPVGCDPWLDVELDPLFINSAGGETVVFEEWITALDGCGTVHCTVEFKADETVIGVQEIWIEILDVEPPVINCPPDVTAECPTDTSPASTGEATATDNCDPEPTIDFDDDSVPGCGGTETITRTWTATDDSDNASLCVQTVRTVDTVPPTVIPGPGNEVCLWPPNHKFVLIDNVNAGVSIIDACDPNPVAAEIACQSDQCDDAPCAEHPGENGDGKTFDDCRYDVASDRLAMRSERAGTDPDGRLYSLSLTGADGCGNHSAAVEVFTGYVPHVQSPPQDCLKPTGGM